MKYDDFLRLPDPQPDAVFAANQRAKAFGPGAINATVGVIVKDGHTHILPSVRQAMQEIHEQNLSVGYESLSGMERYRTAVFKLLDVKTDFAAGVATTGGTEAMALNTRMLHRVIADPRVIVPVPTWANHDGVLKEAGIKNIAEVDYLRNGRPDISQIVDQIRMGADAVLLHGVCHNPTGLDLTPQQWQELAKEMEKRGIYALLDIAYQGLGEGPKEDVESLRILTKAGVMTLVGWSASKNHTIYNERAGFAAAYGTDAKMKRKMQGEYELKLRRTHSSTAAFGQRVVAQVQEQHQNDWVSDLGNVRAPIRTKRVKVADVAKDSTLYSLHGNGLFGQPMTAEESLRAEKKGLFGVEGRINFSSIEDARLGDTGETIVEVRGK